LSRVFLLSPASCSGNRARIVLSERATFDLAVRLRQPQGAPIGEVFSFLSGLYFRGKLTYANAFARAPEGATAITGRGVFVITPSSGLRSPETMLTLDAIRAFAAVDVDAANPKYRRPLERSARALADDITSDTTVVLLGSIASGKYVDVLQGVFGSRLMFPQEFVGRGDMSRGGLLLRCAAAGQELAYVPIAGAVRHGTRPPKLDPATRVRLR
jgi:hypothetical protein